MVYHCTHERREPESQGKPNSLVVPCYDCGPLHQTVEGSFDWVPLTVRIRVPFPKVLCFGPKRILTLLCLNLNPPNGVVEMAEQGIRDLEERLSR